MIEITDTLNSNIDIFPLVGYNNSDVVFFDIETTGFSPKSTTVYLIGCIYYEDSSWVSKSWFANSPSNEVEVLTHFFDFVQNFNAIIHYNGEGIDIPYLQKKATQYNLCDNLKNKVSIDIYKMVSPLRHIFKLENLKLKSIEKFLGINREDTYNGGELISVYNHYVMSPNEYDYKRLMLHNKEDIYGLLNVVPILSYYSIVSKRFTVTGASILTERTELCYVPKTLCIELKFDTPFPKRITHAYNEFSFTALNQTGTIKVGIYTNELKYFYSNYKDYYYLPYEDTAIHKSVAFYVDKDYRTRAKAANCYSKKSGRFVPEYNEGITPYFKIDYYDKKNYFELTDDVLSNLDIMHTYACHIFDVMLEHRREK